VRRVKSRTASLPISGSVFESVLGSVLRPALASVLLSFIPLAGTGFAQADPAATSATKVLQRVEAIDSVTGVHSVRLLLSLPGVEADPNAEPPRFTVECQELKGNRELLWFVSFGGIGDPGFVAPFVASQSNLFPPQYPAVNLKMSFEGYLKSKPFTRSWSALPSGELRYRNPGMSSPNMDSTRYFMTFLNSLPGLRIGYAKPGKAQPGDLFFPTQPLLDALRKTPICLP